jgi:hypothetical protein
MTKKIVIYCLISLAALAALGSLVAHNKATAASAAQATREVSSLKKSVRAMAEERTGTTVIVQAPRPEHGTEPAATAPLASAESAQSGDPVTELSAEERQYQTEILNDATTQLVSQTMEREPADPRWSNQAVELIRSTYGGEDFASVTISASCKSTLCKISLTSQDPMQGETALRKMLQSSPWPTNGIAAYDPKKGEGFMYLAREGSELPRVDPATLTF